MFRSWPLIVTLVALSTVLLSAQSPDWENEQVFAINKEPGRGHGPVLRQHRSSRGGLSAARATGRLEAMDPQSLLCHPQWDLGLSLGGRAQCTTV